MRNELKCECNYRYVVIRHSFCYEIISLSRAMNLFIGKFEFAYESFNLLICSYFVSIASPLSIYFLPFIAIIIIRARTTVDDFHFISFHWNRFVPSVFVFALRYIQLFSSHKLFQWIYQAWASACACYSIYFIAGLCHFPCFVDYIVCSFGCFCTMTQFHRMELYFHIVLSIWQQTRERDRVTDVEIYFADVYLCPEMFMDKTELCNVYVCAVWHCWSTQNIL